MEEIKAKQSQKKTKSLKVNAIFNALYQLLTLLAPIITTPYVSRVFMSSTIGSYNYYYSILGYFTLVAAFGFVDFGTKFIAEKRDNAYDRSQAFYSIFLAKFFLSFVCLIVYLIMIFVFYRDDKTVFYIFLSMSLYIISIMLDPLFFFQGVEKFGSICLRNMIMRLFTIIFIFVIVKNENDIIKYALVLSIGNFLAVIISFLSFKKGDLVKPNFKDIHIFKYFRDSTPYFIAALAVGLFTYLSQTMVGIFSSDPNQNGYFSQGSKIVVALASVSGSISTVMLSRMSYLFKNGTQEEIKHKVHQTFEAFWAVSLPMTLGYISVNKYLIPLFLGAGYEGAIGVGYALSPIIILSSINGLIGALYFRPFNKTWVHSAIILFSSLVNIIVCIVLIPLYGAIGAALGRVVAELVQLPLLLYYSQTFIDIKMIFKSFIKPADNSIIMFISLFGVDYLCSKFIQSNFIMMTVIVIVGVLIYFVLSLITKDSFVLSMMNWVFGKFKRRKTKDIECK